MGNLLAIGEACDPSFTPAVASGLRYGDFKKRVADAVIARLEPIQKKYREIAADPGYVQQVLSQGRERVLPLAENTVRRTKQAMGLYV